MGKIFSILGFAGSLRRGSQNKARPRAVRELVPEGVVLAIFDPEGIPPFNQDLEDEPVDRVRNSRQRSRPQPGVIEGAERNRNRWRAREPHERI